VATEEDVVIAWNHGPTPPAAKPAFQRPTRFINLPNPDKWSQALAEFGGSPVRGILAKYAPGITPLRVALLGFSASCQGVAQVLASSDGGRIDSVVAVDGIHVGYSDKATKKINEAGMKPWLDFGAQAAVNERLFVDSYSSVVPPGYASTTETANWLWEKLTSNSEAFVADPAIPEIVVPPTSITTSTNHPSPYTAQYPSAPWKAKRRARGLIMLGCNNVDPTGTTDHIYQGTRMLPVLLQTLLAGRWNGIDPKAPGAACFISGASSHPADFFMLGSAECAKSVVLPANYMLTKDATPLPTASVAPAAQYSTAKGIGVGTVVAVGALGLGALWWMSRGVALAENQGTPPPPEPPTPHPVRVLPYTVTFAGDVATIRYKTADDAKRHFELRVKRHGNQGGVWDLYDAEGRHVSGGTVGDFGDLNYARGPALPQTVDKAERVLRSTGIWGYTGANKTRWGVDQP